ncbi:hypothetical protein B0H11DRAFT_1991418 [Mycena galericulata]|nr:hypothetical protein B0H11DRAFT_1991418 [Mycena galericulata]
MPEKVEGGRFFQRYVQRYLGSKFVKDNPGCTRVQGFYADVIQNETQDMLSREKALQDFCGSESPPSLLNNTHKAWAHTICTLALAIPDTHGLLIPGVWQQLPIDIRSQISPNHTNWSLFCQCISHLDHTTQIVPALLPTPWYQLQDSNPASILPYKIGASPSKSGLVVKLTREMPSIYRVNTDRKAIAALDPDAADAVTEDEPSDLDSDEETEEPNHKPNDNKSDNKSRFLWPQHPSQVASALSNHNVTPQDAFISADLELQAVHYHPRRLILDLKSAVLEVNFHERGYKVAFAIKMITHILALLSHDNLWNLFWRSSTEFTRLQKQRVPDSVLGFHAWCQFHVEYFKKNPPKRRTQLTIYQWLIKPGPHPFQGSGRYCTAEVLALAGIPAWTSAFDVLTRPELYSVLIEADAQFHSERLWIVDNLIDRMLEGNTSDDFSLGASVQDQKEYSTHLRVHGKKEWHVSPQLAELVRDYNDIAIRTKVEAQDSANRSNIFIPKADIASATHPFDLSNIAPTLLCFGHLGELIVGKKRWTALLKDEIPDDLMTCNVHFLSAGQKKLRKALHNYVRRLPCDLSPFQRLSLTPIPCLSLEELNLLSLQFGNTNPVAQYFRDYQNEVLHNLTGAKRPPTMTPKLPFRLDLQSLSLLPDPRRPCRLPTNLLHIKNQKRGKIWTVLEAPWMEQQKRVEVGPNGKSKKMQVNTGLQLWPKVEDSWKFLISYIKTKTLGWTVGPCDFCGHGHVIGTGVRGRFKGLCFWHQDMSDEQMLLMQKNWTSRSQWKLSRAKTIRDTVPNISKPDLGIELRKKRASERQQLTEQGIDLAAAALESAQRFQSGSKTRGKLYSTIVPSSRKYKK